MKNIFETRTLEKNVIEKKVEISPETISRISEEEDMLKKYQDIEKARLFRIATISAVAKKISPEAAKWLI